MGRKIPGRKHRGVRDPAKQHAVRQENLKNKINAPPSQEDEQFIPKSLARIIDLKTKLKDGSFGRKRKKAGQDAEVKKHRSGKPVKPIPRFVQQRGESDRQFLYRVNKMTESVIKEAKFEKKYGVDVKRNFETGEVEGVVKRERDEIDELERKNRSKKKTKIKKSDKNEQPKLTKSQKRSEKLKEKKRKKLDSQIDDFKSYEDQIKFGEVVNAPPVLSRPTKVQGAQETSRPGKRQLLLKSLLNKSETESEIKAEVRSLHKVQNKTIDKKGKRKNLPNALRRQLDKQQFEVIQAYKELKGKKHEQT